MADHGERAVGIFSDGFNCAQAVFSAHARQVGIAEQDALRIAGGFGAGIGRMQEVCGAVSGAVMLLGCRFGKVRREDDAARETTYRLARELAERFRELNGSIGCRELLGCDIGTEEGRLYARERDLYNTRCARFVRDASAIVERLLDPPDPERPGP